MIKVIITGGSGLLGQYLNLAASGKYDILTNYNSNPGNCLRFNFANTDLRDEDRFNKLFADFKPNIVIHSAAITNPIPKPDQNPKLYYDVNVKAAKNLAGLCEKFNSKLIYISTDLVYAGYRGSMLKEDAKLIPVSLYADTKLMGEVKIQGTLENYIILRTSLLYGFGLNHSRCHFHNMFEDLKNKKPVKLFIDQFRTPISIKEAARIIIELLQTEIKTEIINLGGMERNSRYELGEILCNEAGFDNTLLEKISMSDVPQLPKVEDVSLNTDKLQSFGIKPRSIKENIHELIKGN